MNILLTQLSLVELGLRPSLVILPLIRAVHTLCLDKIEKIVGFVKMKVSIYKLGILLYFVLSSTDADSE